MRESDENADQQNHAAAGEPPPRLAEDQFYRALASTHRRRLLYHLIESGESTAGELASVLSAWEVSSTGTMDTQADRSRILVGLLQKHLPRLADAGLITYDPDTGTVQLSPVQPQVREIVRQSIKAERLEPSE